MTLLLVGKDIVLDGLSFKEDKKVAGVYMFRKKMYI